MTILDDRRFLIGFATAVMFTGFAGDAVRNSIGWYAYGTVVVAIAVVSIAIIARRRADVVAVLPWPLVAFLLLAAASTAWSAYPAVTALATLLQLVTSAAGIAIALTLGVTELLRAFGWALRAILSLSILFELLVALVVRAPVLPVWVTADDRVDPPLLLYWSRNVLLAGEPIQGIPGSSSLLAMAALLAVVVFGVQLAARDIRRVTGIVWIAVAVLVIALTRSATIYLGLAAVAVVLVMILVVRRAATRGARRITYAVLALGIAALIATGIALRSPVLAAFGKSDDLTGRLGIWEAVIGLATQRPVVGWGWTSFWAPWVEPYRDLVTRNGVVQLHAHNAWLDVWLQLGIIGLTVFAAYIATTAVRSWLLATDRVIAGPDDAGRFSALALAAPLILTALLVQSLAESRLLIEGGWILLAIIAVVTKRGMLGRRSAAPADGAAAVTADRSRAPGSDRPEPKSSTR